jgi:hypothetical protein
MIIRVFTPTSQPGKSAELESFLRDTAAPLVAQQPGLVAQQEHLLMRTRIEHCDVLP